MVLKRDREPRPAHEVFAVDAMAGQTLLLEVEADPEAKILVVAPGAPDSRPLTTLPGVQEVWIGALERSGTYRVIAEVPGREPYVLRLTLMNPHDTRLDPGIAPEKVSIDLSAIGVKEKLSRKPYDPEPAGLAGECWPANLAVVARDKMGFRKIEVRIMSVDAIRKAFWREKGDKWPEGLALLEQTLKTTGQTASPFKLPRREIEESGLQFAVLEKRVDGKSFAVERWLAYFSIIDAPPQNPLYYVAEGLSHDGTLFLLIRAEVETPLLTGLGDFKDEEELEAIRKRVGVQLTGAPATAFQPALAVLDRIVQGIEVK